MTRFNKSTNGLGRLRRLAAVLLLVFTYVGSAGHDGGGCCSDEHGSGFPDKDMVFTKMRGPNVEGLEGTDVMGKCTADERGKAACYGLILIHCSDDGEPHARDCSKKLGTTMCDETATTADCQ